MTVLSAICFTQAFMMWKFINFQLRRWREHAEAQTLKKKQAPAKSKSKKDKGGRARNTQLQINCENKSAKTFLANSLIFIFITIFFFLQLTE